MTFLIEAAEETVGMTDSICDGGMKAADVFSGTRSVGDILLSRGWNVEFIDILDGTDVRGYHPSPDLHLLWESPPCNAFSVAGFRWWHFKGGVAQTDTARLGVALMKEALRVKDEARARWWVIENPRGLMRKMPEMADLPRVTVTYCQYGDTRMKPTDLFTNIPPLVFQSPCRPKAPCHATATRGSRHMGTTNGQSSARDRGRIPRGLTETIAEWCEANP